MSGSRSCWKTGDASSAPNPWIPSTQSRTRANSSRPSLASATASAMSRSGSFTPLDECTHVTATARVRGVIPSAIAETIVSAEAVSGASTG